MKKLVISVLIGLFTYLSLKYLWPNFRDGFFDYQWYLMYSGALWIVTTSISIVLAVITVTLGVVNRSKNKHAQVIVTVLGVVAFLSCIISVAIKMDMKYYF